MGKRILVVDDDCDLVLGLRLRLESMGYSVTSVSDAVAAQAVISKDPPDALILDLGLPGEGGLAFLTRLREQPGPEAELPVIVLTARDEGARAPALAAGAQVFFQKPVESWELVDAITAVA
jgi:two-component system KDP operon response regulator KdpE